MQNLSLRTARSILLSLRAAKRRGNPVNVATNPVVIPAQAGIPCTIAEHSETLLLDLLRLRLAMTKAKKLFFFPRQI